MKLTDTQLVMLSAAGQRENRFLLPLPRSLKGGAATKVVTNLLSKGLIEEVEAKFDEPRWRETGDGHGVTLVLTEAGLAALDGDVIPPEPAKTKKAAKPAKAKVARKPRKVAAKPDKTPATRGESKQAKLIAMLKAPKGGTVEEIASTFGWQTHTVRGAIAGALKKRLGLDVTAEKVEGRGRVYRITG